MMLLNGEPQSQIAMTDRGLTLGDGFFTNRRSEMAFAPSQPFCDQRQHQGVE